MHSLYEYSYAMEEGLAVLSGLLTGIPYTMLGLVTYVFTALTLYTVAKRRGIHKSWLAWIPGINVWLLGSISDQYRYVVKGQIKSKRKVLLILQIAVWLLGSALVVAGGAVVLQLLGSMANFVNRAQVAGRLFRSVGLVAALALPTIGAVIAYKVFYFITLYDVYTSLDPENSALFLVLSILFPVTEAFFLFFNRNADKGMPPRREAPVQEPWQQEDKDYV